MQVIIQFLGLIAHMHLGSHNTAVMPRVTGHHPRLIMVLSNTYYDIALDNSYVVVSGATGTFNRTRISDVPQIKDITGCGKVLPSVETLTEQTKVTTYVDFTDGGDLFGRRVYPKPVHFDHAQGSSNWVDRHCASCEVQYRATPVSSALTITITDFARTVTRTYSVKPDDLVIFQNEPDSAGSADHFKYFYDLLDNCSSAAVPNENEAEACGKVPLCTPKKLLRKKYRYLLKDPAFTARFLTPTVECTNSQWP